MVESCTSGYTAKTNKNKIINRQKKERENIKSVVHTERPTTDAVFVPQEWNECSFCSFSIPDN